MSLRNELRMKKPFSSREEEAVLSLQRTHGVVLGPVHRFLKSSGLSQPLYNILRILRGQGGEALACSQIGERMVTREPDVTRLLDRLVRDGLVERRRSDEDRRVVLVSITRAGLDLLAGMDQTMVDLHKEILGHLTAGEIKELTRLLTKARQSSKEGI
jgi:DNA-binding MarR family transcriptional regulator